MSCRRIVVGARCDRACEGGVVAREIVAACLVQHRSRLGRADPHREIERLRQPRFVRGCQRRERHRVGRRMAAEEAHADAGASRRAGAVEEQRLATARGPMTESIDGHHVRDVLRVLERHVERGGELGELAGREIIRRPPDEREEPRDPRPRRMDGGIEVALRDAREEHRGTRMEPRRADAHHRPRRLALRDEEERRGGQPRQRTERARPSGAARDGEAPVVDGRAEQQARLRATSVCGDARDLLRDDGTEVRRRRDGPFTRQSAGHRDDAAGQAQRFADLHARSLLLGDQAPLELGREDVEVWPEHDVLDLRERAIEGDVDGKRQCIERDHVRDALLAHVHVECTYSDARRWRQYARGVRSLDGAFEHDAVAIETLATGCAELVPHAGRAFEADQRLVRDGELDGLRRSVHVGVDGLPVPLGERREARGASLLGQRGRRTEQALSGAMATPRDGRADRERSHGEQQLQRRDDSASYPTRRHPAGPVTASDASSRSSGAPRPRPMLEPRIRAA